MTTNLLQATPKASHLKTTSLPTPDIDSDQKLQRPEKPSGILQNITSKDISQFTNDQLVALSFLAGIKHSGSPKSISDMSEGQLRATADFIGIKYTKKSKIAGALSKQDWIKFTEERASRSFPKKIQAFLGSAIGSTTDLMSTFIKSTPEMGDILKNYVDFNQKRTRERSKRALKTFAEGAAAGTMDLIQLLKMIGGNVGDQFEDNPEERLDRGYKRYLDSLIYAQKRKEGIFFGQKEIYPHLKESTSVVLDPTILLPFAKGPGTLTKQALRKTLQKSAKAGAVTTKTISKGSEKLAKLADTPRRAAEKVLSAIYPEGAERLRLTGKLALAAPFSPALVRVPAQTHLGAALTAHGTSFASDILKGAGAVDQKKRFLRRIMTDPETIANHPNLARTAAFAHRHGGEAIIDAAFNAMADGLQISTLQAALAFAAGGGAEEIGAGVGTGITLAGLTFPLTGQRGAGATEASRIKGSINKYIQTLDQDTRSTFQKLPDHEKALLATLGEIGMPVKTQLLPEDIYITMASARGSKSKTGFFDENHNEILLNVDSPIKSSVLLHEIGHKLLSNVISSDPLAARGILSMYGDPKGLELKFKDGETIKVNDQIRSFIDEYNKLSPDQPLQIAEEIAGEVGAESFAYMLADSHDATALTKDKGILGNTIEASHRLLNKLGLTREDTGGALAPKDYNPISKTLTKNPTVEKLLKNYIRLRTEYVDWQNEVAVKKFQVVPKKGESTWEAVLRTDPQVKLIPRDDILRADGKLIIKTLREFEKQNPPKPGEVRLGKGGAGQKINPELLKLLQWKEKAPDLYNSIKLLENSIDQNKKIVFHYSPRARSKGNTKSNIYEGTPFTFFLSERGNLSVKLWDEGKLQMWARTLVDRGAIQSKEKLLDAVQAASDRQKVGDSINDHRVAALMGGGTNIENIPEGIWRDIAKEIKHSKKGERKSIITQFRIDSIVGLKDLNKPGLAFRYEDVRNNNHPGLSMDAFHPGNTPKKFK